MEFSGFADSCRSFILVKLAWQDVVLLSIRDGMLEVASEAPEIIILTIESAVNDLLFRESFGLLSVLEGLGTLKTGNHCESI